ncbi:MAG: Ig-like domain-containing protein, partial [Thermoanaerobaculales bacterium]
MKATPPRLIALSIVMLALAAFPMRATADAPLASGRLQVQGARLTIYADPADPQKNDANQAINLGESARVRTCYGGLDTPCGAVVPGDPRIAGLMALADLRGPDLPEPVPLRTLPGGAFVLPGFQQQGDYRLENIRLVASDGHVIGTADPPVAVLHVLQIMLASATVTNLTLADLQARGITLSQQNFQAFNFAIGFALDSGQTFTIDFPVLYQGNGQLAPLTQPDVHLDGLEGGVAASLARWQPPQIVPFMLELPKKELLAECGGLFVEDCEQNEVLRFPVFGAIVIPGTLSFLNQFFDARLIVTNGAPTGSGAALDNVMAALRLPSGNVLRLAATTPPVAPGQQVPIAAGTGGRTLSPGSQGSASWTIEGLVAGTHVLAMDITADLTRPGRTTVPVASTAQAAVEVVDARFNLTFSHPDVVREGEAYTLFVTVTNMTRVVQNDVTLSLGCEGSSQSGSGCNDLVGAHKADPNDGFTRQIDTLPAGGAETVEFPLVADVTGQVVATTFQSDSPGLQGVIHLRTGVGELGIPLSPASLVMPRFTERLAKPYIGTDDFVRANVRLLGLAYSLAISPAGAAPAGLPHVIKADVVQRAVDIAEAGQRTFLHEPLFESLKVLALDQLGNRHQLAEFDTLRRSTGKGLAAATQLGALLRQEQASRGLDAVALLDHFGTTTSYARPYLAATVVPTGSDPAPVLELRRETQQGTVYLAYSSDQQGALRSLPYGEIYAVGQMPSLAALAPLAVVGHIEPTDLFLVSLHNDTDSPNEGRLVVVVPDASLAAYRRIEFPSISVPPHTVVGVNVGAGVPDLTSGGFKLYYPQTLGLVAGTPPAVQQAVQLPPFRLIAAVQDYGLPENQYGNGLSYLFNRPPLKASAEDPSHYRIRSTFNGLDVNGNAVGTVAELQGKAAFLQPSERVVNVRYSSPLSALVDPATNQPLLAHEHQLDTNAIQDTRGNSLDPTTVPPPTIESSPLHVGGLVDGKVVRGTGEGAPGVSVQLFRKRREVGDTSASGFENMVVLDLVSEATTDHDGHFYFDFIEEPPWASGVMSGYTLRATVPAGSDPTTEPEAVQEVGSIIRQQNRLAHVNIALLGRGTVKGRLVWAGSHDAVTGGTVVIASTLFGESKSQLVGADGSFFFATVPIGPLTLTGRDPSGLTVYATVALAQPGTVVETQLEIERGAPPPSLGGVTGRVMQQPPGTPAPPAQPVAGADVAVYSHGAMLGQTKTDAVGFFQFTKVPVGQVSVQAADWQVSRAPAFTDLMLAADEIADVTLTLPASTPHAITGKVYLHEPIGNTLKPVQGAVVFIRGQNLIANTDATGAYRIGEVPTQNATDSYDVIAIDYTDTLQGSVNLPPVTDASPDVIVAADIVLKEMTGGVDGIVLDPLGNPYAGAEVVLFPYGTAVSGVGGSFSFNDVGVGHISTDSYPRLIAHVGDGLTAGKEGYLGAAQTDVLYAGHRPFVTIQLRGAGTIRIHTRTSTSNAGRSLIYYKPTFYSDKTFRIESKPEYLETNTGDDGDLELTVPVGPFEVDAYNPFHGLKTVADSLEFAGQVKDYTLTFDDASKVRVAVVDVDGVTPVPYAVVTLKTGAFLPETEQADAQGKFEFDLVPPGGVVVSAAARVGVTDRVGVTTSSIGGPAQTLDLFVQMKAQGSAQGRVVERVGSDLEPLAHAQYYVTEASFPFRRLPAVDWYFTDANGEYEVSHLNAGPITITARDSLQVDRQGYATTVISADWQVASVPDIVMSTSVGSIAVVVRDPDTGAGVADCQVKLPLGPNLDEVTVADAEGKVQFDALPLGTYSIYAFHAPSGRGGRVEGVNLASAGQHLETVIYLDHRGEIDGTLFDDASKVAAVPGGTVAVSGDTLSGRLSALATTSSDSLTLGRFSFPGMPEGHFSLEAAVPTSSRRARATVDLNATSPVAAIDLVLEPTRDIYFRVFENLKSGLNEVNPVEHPLSVRLVQERGCSRTCVYDFTRLQPSVPSTSLFLFPDVLSARGGGVTVQELGGEQRSAQASVSDFETSTGLPGSGTAVDPYQLVLGAKGVVRVWVKTSLGQAVADASVTLNGAYSLSTDSNGSVVFTDVPAGGVTASAHSPLTGFGGLARGQLVFDDDVIELTIVLAPAVSVHGIVYQPVANDCYGGDPTGLVAESGAPVHIRDAQGNDQLIVTGPDGIYHFDGLSTGAASIDAHDATEIAVAQTSMVLVGPDGNDNQAPPLLLDGSPPKVVSIRPAPGTDKVSRTATVEIVFSELLDPTVLPNGESDSGFFHLRSAAGSAAVGAWTAVTDGCRQVVRFTPGQPYENSTDYNVTIVGRASGVRDRVGRPLAEFGDVGSTFKTSDTVGPSVVGSDPTITRPVDPTKPIRFDFSEPVFGSDGLLKGDAVVLTWEKDNGAGGTQWEPLTATVTLSSGGMSLIVAPVQDVTLDGDTGHRHIVIAKLTDAVGNPMVPFDQMFRIVDHDAPVIHVNPPADAPDGNLLASHSYALTPILDPNHLEDKTDTNQGGDVDRVEYFTSDPAGATQPAFSTQTYPFSFAFVAAYSGDGHTPRPFPVWVQAVDTSDNRSEVEKVEMQVVPNALPTIGAVSTTAVAPVAGVFYAGSLIRATVAGLGDPDGVQITVAAALWQPGGSAPTASLPGVLVSRPASGSWSDLAPPTFDFTIPVGLAEGSELFVRATAVDSYGGQVTLDSAHFAVAHDATPPVVDNLILRNAATKSTTTRLSIGDTFFVEFRAHDAETAVSSASVAFSSVFTASVPAVLVPGSGNLYRSGVLTVPVVDQTTVAATASAHDYGANVSNSSVEFQVGPAPDPTAPTVQWLTPWEGAAWPANYTSVIDNQAGVTLLLRVRAADTSLEGGVVVPGNIFEVAFRGPVSDGRGGVALASTWTAALLVAGTEAPGAGVYEQLWHVPNAVPAGASLPFEVRVTDTGGLSVVQPVHMTAGMSRKVYEGTITAALPTDTLVGPGGDSQGAVFLLDGATLSLYPQTDGTVRSLRSLYLYPGAELGSGGSLTPHPSVLTAPEVSSYGSSILYYPLELGIGEVLGIGAACRIDVSERGLLGNNPSHVVALPGETAAGPLAGGSHGGAGWFGSPTGCWDCDSLSLPGSTYDSVRDPRLPGGGGTASDCVTPSSGGGVVRVLAPGASLRLEGEMRADGGSGSSSGYLCGLAGAGAGGTIALSVGRIEGQGRISAVGGPGGSAGYTGGGGGGRIAVVYREVGADTDLTHACDASGGANAAVAAQATRSAGAGTVYLEQLDALAGTATGIGAVLIAGVTGLPAAMTPLPALGSCSVVDVDPANQTVTLDGGGVSGSVVGDRLVVQRADGSPLGTFAMTSEQAIAGAAPGSRRVRIAVDGSESDLATARSLLDGGEELTAHGRTRFATVQGAGSVRLAALDDLEIGAADEAVPSLNDRSRLLLTGEARARLRGELPVVKLTATPDGGSDVGLGGQITLSWSADDYLGFNQSQESWTLSSTPTTRWFGEQPLHLGDGPTDLAIPTNATPGPATFSVAVRDLDGQTYTRQMTWNVLANRPPSATLALAAGAPGTVKAGSSTTVIVHATDPEGLAAVTLNATGPATAPTQSVAVSGTAQDVTFTVRAAPTASGQDPIVLQAGVTDFSGASANSAPLQITVTPNAPPTGSVSLAQGASAQLQPGHGATLNVHAEDSDGLGSIQLLATGPVTQPSQALTVAGTSADVSFTVTATSNAPAGPINITAVITDAGGVSFTTPALILTVVVDNPPTGAVTVTPSAGVYPNHQLVVTVNAQDDNSLRQAIVSVSGAVVDSRTLAFGGGTTGQVSRSFHVPIGTAPGTQMVVAVEVDDTFGHQVQLTPVAVPILADTAPPVITTISPAVSFTMNEGDTVTFQYRLQDVVSVASTALVVNGQPVSLQMSGVQDPGDFWQGTASATWRAPAVEQDTMVAYSLTATDQAGNQAVASGQLTVKPIVNPNAPVVAISCPANGDGCAPGAPLTVSFTITDTDNIRDYSVIVDEQTLLANQSVNQTQFQGTYTWTPPSTAKAGDTFGIRIEARDYADNLGKRQITVAVPQGTILSGNQNLDASRNNQALVLGAGTYTVTTPLALTSLTLLQGASVVGVNLQPLQLTVATDLDIACGSSINVSGQGYPGNVTYPGGVVPGSNSGGSHLGYGGVSSGPAGSVFGSVTRPQEDGGGGENGSVGMRGGGVVRLSVGGSMVVDGAIRADGASGDSSNWYRGGAGGSVWLEVTGSVSG